MDEDAGAAGETRTVAAVETTFDIVDALLDLGGATMTELTERLDYSKSAVHSHLHTLEEQEYVVREGYRYRPSLKFFDVGQRVAREHLLVYRAGTDEVQQLAQETGEDGWIMFEEWGRGIYVYRQRGQRSVDDFPLGRPTGLHSTAAGKAVLAYLPEARVESIVDRHGLPAVTDRTITTREELHDELDEVRERGAAFSRGESVPGIRAVATPVVAPDGTVLGAISVSGPASRLTGDWFEDDLPTRLQESSNLIEINAMKETDEYTF
jgi:DNA-binding IclR family transcriptional regulator